MTQEIRDFSLSIDKRRQEAANLHCGCTYLQNDPLVDVVLNNNNTVVYRKGPLALVRIAEQIEYGELMHVISGFYREYAGKYPLKYTDFINRLNESYSGVGGPPQPLADRSLFVGRPTFPLARSAGKMSFSRVHAVAFGRLASSYK